MLRWILRVDSWLDVASLENVEEDHSFLFLKKNLMKIFFFFLNFENLNFSKELKILNFFFKKNLEILNFWRNLKKFDWWIFFFFFESGLRSTSPMPLVPRPFLKIFFFFLFFFWKFGNLEFFHGIEIFDWWFFFWKI